MIKKVTIFSLIALYVSSCDMEQISKGLYKSEEFSVYANRVIQDTFKAEAKSSTHIVSNYRSPGNLTYNPLIKFKFAINGKNNEFPPGITHKLFARGSTNKKMTSPVYTYGERDSLADSYRSNASLPPNTKITFRVNMQPVLNSFEENGYYKTWNNKKIHKEDFNGVWVAGSGDPLTWEFEDLEKRSSFKLHDKDSNGIYEREITLNPFNMKDSGKKEWKLTADISEFPSYNSGEKIINALYNMSLEELKQLVRDDNTFSADAKREGIWTRDISYSILLSLATITPELAKNSLMERVKNKRILQDPGTGGGYPVSTDRIVWILAAWEVYKVTGDTNWLQKIFPVIRNAIEADLQNAWDKELKLFRGESSFFARQNQSYPHWLQPSGIYESYNLTTNALFYQSLHILEKITNILDKTNENYQIQAKKIKQAINTYFWIDNKGIYGQYLYGHNYPVLSTRASALGESLSVLFGISDSKRSKKIIRSTPVMNYGIPCIYPQVPDVAPYYNNAVWPFVQAYHNWAAAKAKNSKALAKGLASIYRQAALFLTNKGNLIAETGDYYGTRTNANRQLCSVAGNLAMVYRIFFGLEFQTDKLVFDPTIPKNFGNSIKKLTHFKYREAQLEIFIKGYGNRIEDFVLDDKKLDKPHIPTDLKGKHEVTIFMNDTAEKSNINHVKNHVAPKPPRPIKVNNKLAWKSRENINTYRIYRNGKLISTTHNNFSQINNEPLYSEYQISAVDSAGWESFISKPVKITDPKNTIEKEAENYSSSSKNRYYNYSGYGYVKLEKDKTVKFTISIDKSQTGSYFVDFKYANGHGPVHSGSKCAIRTLMIDGQNKGSVIFPQRGEDEWSMWGYTNTIDVYLEEGTHTFTVTYKRKNKNMSKNINNALLDKIRLIRYQPSN